jgi:Putative beta-barrel porin-2, OmpL-like. bbp2
MSWTILGGVCILSYQIFSLQSRDLIKWKCERGREGEENHMNRTTRCLSKWAAGLFAAIVAIACTPASRAEDQPPPAATQPASASQPAATAAATQPAATAQPTSDQRLEQLEKEVELLQQEIASLKTDSAASMKTAAYAVPGGQPGAVAFTPGAAGDDAPPKISIASLLGPVTLSGFGDVYYGYDNNHPYNNLSGLRSFEAPTNGFNFNMAELILDKAGDATSMESRLGYHVSAGYGYGAKLVNGSDTAFTDGSNFFVKEAYLSYLFPLGKGLTLTVGKFVTPMGAEVIESNANWNYSRGLLFDYAIPFFHFGASAKYAFNPKWALTGYMVNGWNNTNINNALIFTSGITGTSSNLTYGASLAYTPNMKWSVIENYFAGPVNDGIGFFGQNLNEWKQISDTVITYTPNAKWAFELNGDYGFGPVVYQSTDCSDVSIRKPASHPVPEGGFFFSCDPTPVQKWGGVAGYAKYTWSPKTNFAVRYEWYDDATGFTGLLSGPLNGNFGRGWAQEVTGTYSYNLTSALLIRGEYRYDFANKPIFIQSLSSSVGEVKQQNTATISFVYNFSSANLK